MNASDRVAVITGGGNGIGAALAARLARAGWRIVVGDIERDRAEQVAQAINSDGGAAIGIRTDVSQPYSVEALRDAAIDTYGRVNLLCNSAGITTVGTAIVDTEPVDWWWALEVNVLGTVQCIRTFLPVLNEQLEARIVNLASITSFIGSPFNAIYCATKAALLSISESLRAELEADGHRTRVSVVCPGSVATTIAASETRRPERLSRRGSDKTRPDVQQMINEVRQHAIPPDAVAARIITAIQNDEFYVFTHDSVDIVKARTNAALAELAAASPEPDL